ncbi:MAG: hypothetical protein ABIE23_06015 [archaeon]
MERIIKGKAIILLIFMNWLSEGAKKSLNALRNYFMHQDLQNTRRSECAAILLGDVKHPDHYFYLKGEIPVKNLCELSSLLNDLDEYSFNYHVGNERNDFSEWIDKTIGDRTLAGKLNQLHSREEMAKAVEVRVDYFKRKAEQRY